MATTLVGADPGSALEECIFCHSTRFPGKTSGHSATGANSWTDELTPERRALVAGSPRGFGHDGQLLSNEQQLAPSLLSINGQPDAPEREEVWFWDLRGYLVLHNVMDHAWLAQCNAALDSPFAQANRRPVELSNSVVGAYPNYEGCSQTIAPAPGTRCTEERVSQTWAHPSPFSDGFRRMIDNPLVNAPHTADDVMRDWDRPYDRERAIYPTADQREDKYWPPVNRIDQVYGDRHLVCSCPPLDAYLDAAE